MDITFKELLKKMKRELASNKGKPTELFYKLQNLVIEKNNPEYAYELASKQWEGLDIKGLGQVVIATKDPEKNYYFAHDIGGADIKAHGQVVLDSKDPKWNYYFARDISGADIEAHAQVVLDSKDPFWNYMFACSVGWANIKAHWKVVKKSGDEYYIDRFKRYFGIEYNEEPKKEVKAKNETPKNKENDTKRKENDTKRKENDTKRKEQRKEEQRKQAKELEDAIDNGTLNLN